MKRYPEKPAMMTIDNRRARFRIYRSTLRQLGNPKYIQFLINPEELFIAILGSDKPLAGGTANRVNIIEMKDNRCVEFYSNALLNGIISMIGALDNRSSYHLSGDIDAANRVAYFSMRTLKKVERRTTKDDQGI